MRAWGNIDITGQGQARWPHFQIAITDNAGRIFGQELSDRRITVA